MRATYTCGPSNLLNSTYRERLIFSSDTLLFYCGKPAGGSFKDYYPLNNCHYEVLSN